MSSKIVQRNSKIHGQGVFATAPIKKGEDVIEYKGKLRTHEEVDEEYGGKDTGHTFLFILNDTYVIDANIGGNVARWLNHGCAPNCQAFVVEDESGDPRKDKVVIEAIRNIRRAKNSPTTTTSGSRSRSLRKSGICGPAAAARRIATAP
jgi:SET domain-containing protein